MCLQVFFSISVFGCCSYIDISSYLLYTYNNLQKLVRKNHFSHVSIPGREVSIRSEKTNKKKCRNLCSFPLNSSISASAVLMWFPKLSKMRLADL